MVKPIRLTSPKRCEYSPSPMSPSTRQVQRAAAIRKRQTLGYWIYGITDGEHLKVGFAIDIEKRRRGLQTASPRELTVVYRWRVTQWKKSTAEILNAKNWEKHYHKKLAAHAVRGEWFKLDALQLMRELNAPE
jgi:hypothetical protein